MKARQMISLRFSSLLLLLLSFLSACTDENDAQQGPLKIGTVTANFVTGNTVSFSADFIGKTNDIDEIGFCWSTHSAPTTADSLVTFNPVAGIINYNIQGLISEKTYFVRAYYITRNKIYYSPAVSFTTMGKVTDYNGNEYGIVKIGNQLWMQENLRAVSYSNGDEITDGTRKGNYSTQSNPAFYFNYNDVAQSSNTYGRLYTWHVVNDNRGICPAQWRVPTMNDWEIMIGQLDALSASYNVTQGGIQQLSPIAGGMMRMPGTKESSNGL
jgi:uncharacterized protein (TIGR02145 family)